MTVFADWQAFSRKRLRCPRCETVIPAASIFCPHCGLSRWDTYAKAVRLEAGSHRRSAAAVLRGRREVPERARVGTRIRLKSLFRDGQ